MTEINGLNKIDEIEKCLIRYRSQNAKYYFIEDCTKELKNEMIKRFSREAGYLIEVETCPCKLYTVIITILYEVNNGNNNSN